MGSPIYTLKLVSGITEQPEDVVISFFDGSAAVLGKAERGSEWIITYLRACEERHSPVGVYRDAQDRLADVGAADQNLVLGLQDRGSGADAVDVWFGGMDGPMSLLKTHPRFRDLFADLAAAVAHKRPVWFIMRGGCILDVLRPSPDEEARLGQSVTASRG